MKREHLCFIIIAILPVAVADVCFFDKYPDFDLLSDIEVEVKNYVSYRTSEAVQHLQSSYMKFELFIMQQKQSQSLVEILAIAKSVTTSVIVAIEKSSADFLASVALYANKVSSHVFHAAENAGIILNDGLQLLNKQCDAVTLVSSNEKLKEIYNAITGCVQFAIGVDDLIFVVDNTTDRCDQCFDYIQYDIQALPPSKLATKLTQRGIQFKNVGSDGTTRITETVASSKIEMLLADGVLQVCTGEVLNTFQEAINQMISAVFSLIDDLLKML